MILPWDPEVQASQELRPLLSDPAVRGPLEVPGHLASRLCHCYQAGPGLPSLLENTADTRLLYFPSAQPGRGCQGNLAGHPPPWVRAGRGCQEVPGFPPEHLQELLGLRCSLALPSLLADHSVQPDNPDLSDPDIV